MPDTINGVPRVNGETDPEGIIRIVATADYEELKGAGVGAPWPGHDHVYLTANSWRDDEQLLWRASDADEWEEAERPAEGETFDLPVGASVKLIAPRGLNITGFVR